uniref:Uncharacterized protein n=1 Tax=Arundo donax TaxID=35708 RepID=A0A0A8ZIZ2_ARUDO
MRNQCRGHRWRRYHQSTW